MVVTRLHVRYDDAHFPEDLMFHQTSDKQNFQGRYIMRHPWRGEIDCPEAREYRRRLRERQEQEARTLAHLTGWPLGEIRRKMPELPDTDPDEPTPWWKKLWKEDE